jgi:hypothetical protein
MAQPPNKAPKPAAPKPAAPPPAASLPDAAEGATYRVLSAIKYGGQWHAAGAELTLPAHIALDLKGRVEEIG